MKVLFLGTPLFAVPTLKAIAAQHEILAVFTRPDRPRGRGGAVSPSPVKQEAARLGLPVLQPDPFRQAETHRRARELQADVGVVVAFGALLPPEFLEAPRLGCINLHASLLPAYRGAAPIQWAVTRGETRTGLTSMQMDAGLDTGDILLQAETRIVAEETAVELAHRLADLGGPLMVETLARLERGDLPPRAQPDAGISHAPRLKREDGRIDWRRDAADLFNQVRGMQPWPLAHTRSGKGWLRVLRAGDAGARGEAAAPGTILGVEGEAVHVACGHGTVLALREVQPESRRRMSGRESINGRILRAGDRLE